MAFEEFSLHACHIAVRTIYSSVENSNFNPHAHHIVLCTLFTKVLIIQNSD